jgi:hypothetical protein
MKYIITETQIKRLKESIGIKDLDVVRYIKNLLNKEGSSYSQSPEVTPELKEEMDRLLRMISKMVKGELDLKLIKNVEIMKIFINYSNGVQEITNIVYPITFPWVDESGIGYAKEYEQLKEAFYNFQKMSGMNTPNDSTKRLVKFRFQWDMSHRLKT